MKNSDKHLTPEQLFEKGKELLKQEKSEEALEYYQSAADQGSASAQCKLGECYRLAIGVEMNKKLSVKWFSRAADQENAEAQFNLGVACEFGLGIKKDQEQAVTWYKYAALQGYAPAQYKIGNCYYNGVGIEANEKDAIMWWYRAADEQGYAPAQCALGDHYSCEENEDYDEAQALQWYKLAAEQDYAEAQYKLCEWDYYGTGVGESEQKLAYWFKRAAEQNYPAITPDVRNHYDSYENLDKIENNREIDTQSHYSNDCFSLPQIINKSLELEYGTGVECRQNMVNCAKKSDVLFQNFFSVAKKSFEEKEFEHSPKGDDLFYYIEENLFFILKKHFFLAFNNATLEELSDLSDFFRLLNSTNNRESIIEDLLWKADCSDYENFKILNLAKALDCNNADVLTTYNKIPQPKEVLFSLQQQKRERRKKENNYSPFYSHYFSYNFFVDEDAPNSFWASEPDYRTIRLKLVEGENKKITDVFKPSDSESKEVFEFMCNFWYTYKTLTFNEDTKKDDSKKLSPASEEERKELANDFKKLVFSLIENEADYLSCSAAFELCYIFSCAHYLNKTDESLLDLLVFSYVISYAQLHNIQKIKDVPEEIRKLCYCRDGITAYDVLEKTNKLITGYFKKIKETNEQYNIRMSKSIDLVPFAPIDEFDWLGKDGIREGLMPQVKNFFESRNQHHITLADRRFEKIAKYLIDDIGYERDDLSNFLKDFEERQKHQNAMEYIYDKLYAFNNIIVILSFIDHTIKESSSITDIYYDLTEYFFSVKLKRGQTPESKEFRNGKFFDEHQRIGIDKYKNIKIIETTSENDEFKNEIIKLKNDLDEERQQNEELFAENKEFKKANIKLKNDLDEERQQREELQAKYEKLFAENKELKELIFKLKDDIKYFNDIIVGIDTLVKPGTSINEISKIHANLKTMVRARGINEDDEEFILIDQMVQRIVELVKFKASQGPGYDEVYTYTKGNLPLSTLEGLGEKSIFRQAYPVVKNDPDEETDTFKVEVQKFFNSLVTGEYLYKIYVVNEKAPINKESFDYSCVALQYYTALEHLVNFLFYIPYKKSVLEDELKEKLDNYIGDAKIFDHEQRSFNETLTLGQFRYLCKKNEQGELPQKLVNYLRDELKIDPDKLSKIAKNFSPHISRLRNEAAHGGNHLGKDKAEKARKNVYKDISKCRELIPQILDLFTNQK